MESCFWIMVFGYVLRSTNKNGYPIEPSEYLKCFNEVRMFP